MKSLFRSAATLLSAAVLSTGLLSCGAAIGLGIGVDPHQDGGNYYNDPWNDPFWNGPLYPYSGQWYGDYVFYRGHWHLYGYGTPYYDPYGWNW